MTSPPTLTWLTNEIFELLDETFDEVHGNYLDRGTSLFETLATVSAVEASRPVSARCASIAGQVDHVRFYLDTIRGYMQGTITGKTDWRQSWLVTDVTPDEWDALKQRLRELVHQHRGHAPGVRCRGMAGGGVWEFGDAGAYRLPPRRDPPSPVYDPGVSNGSTAPDRGEIG